MYKVTLNQLIQFNSILPSIEQIKMPLSTAFALNKIKAKLEENFPFYQESLRSIVLDCGELDENGQIIPTEDGKGIKLKNDKQVEFFQRMGDLEQIEVEIEGNKLGLAALENEAFTMEQAQILMPFIEE